MNENEPNAVKALEKIALESITEQRRSRRWSIFFKLAFLAWAFLFLVAFIGSIAGKAKSITTAKEFAAVVDVKGVILDGADASFSLIKSSLKDAFEDKRSKGILLRINSPGGSAVQSAMIHDEILRLKAKHEEMPVYAVIEDIGASGGYYIAAAADEIYANESSLVGSIGVRLESFGVEEAAKKLGVESRLVTAGENKAILDPFRPVTEAQMTHLQAMLATTHKQFIDAVKEGRGERLKENPEIFSGWFWNAVDARELGLVDGFMTADEVARELIQVEELVSFTPKKTLLDRLAGKVGAMISQALVNARLTQALGF